MKKKNRLTTFVLIIIFLLGLSILLYPTVSNYINTLNSTKAIASYVDTVSGMSKEEKEKLIKKAEDFNKRILERDNVFSLNAAEKEEYYKLLNPSNNEIMGYVEIPAIDVSLPIYHGTDESVLQVAAGHLMWSSLPVGGESTHCVLSGHRGLPNAKLFTNLDKLAEGDVFIIRILDEVLTYRIDQILIVEPQDTQALMIEKGCDYCTLVTCTPYGVNTHRLLVRGHRIESDQSAETVKITAELVQIDPMIVAAVIAVPILLVLLCVLLIKYRK